MDIPGLDSKVQKMQLMHRNSPGEQNALLVETLGGKEDGERFECVKCAQNAIRYSIVNYLMNGEQFAGTNGLSDGQSLLIASKNRISKPDSLTFECYTPIGVITGAQNVVLQELLNRDLSSFHCQLSQPEQQPSTALMDSDSVSEEDLLRHKSSIEGRSVNLFLNVTKLTVYSRALNAPVLPKSDDLCGFCRFCVKLFEELQFEIDFNEPDQNLKVTVGYCLKCMRNQVHLVRCRVIDLVKKSMEISVDYFQSSGVYHQGCVAEVVGDAGDIQLYMIEKIPDIQEDGKFSKICREGASRVTLIRESDLTHWRTGEQVEITTPGLTLCNLFHSFSTQYTFYNDNCWNAVESMKAAANSSLNGLSWQKKYAVIGTTAVGSAGAVYFFYKNHQKSKKIQIKVAR